MIKNEKICIAGGRGMVGTALVRRLRQDGYHYCMTADHGIDLRNHSVTLDFFRKEKPDCVILVAARHGGIGEYESKPVEYFNDNLLICSSVITAAFEAGVRKLINIGASCVYGADPTIIYTEEEYDRHVVQKGTEPYGLAKLAGMKLCEYYNREYGTNYMSLLPVNMYGDGDGYDLDFSSVLPAMLRKFHNAKVERTDSVEIWGDGRNTREFLFVDDFIDAIELIIECDSTENDMFNVGGAEQITINELAGIVAEVVGYSGMIVNDLSRPNGSSRGRIDASRIMAMGWMPKTPLKKGIKCLYKNYLKYISG